MPLRYASINSGSNGNCYYIENDVDAILVDAGILCKEIVRRLRSMDLSIDKVRAVFISHEHIDHVRGLDVLTRTYQLPVYINVKTRNNHHQPLDENYVRYIDDTNPIRIGDISIHAFSKKHDAADPISFRVEHQDHSVGVFTDIGSVCENLKHHFSKCHAAFLEANYDEDLLANGSYPHYLKKRISSEHGHLSNKQALELFRQCRSDFMRHILLSHLSQHNNRPEIALAEFKDHAAEVLIEAASRHQQSILYNTDSSLQNKTAPTTPVQLNMFDIN